MSPDPRHPMFMSFGLPIRLRWLVIGWIVAEALVFMALVRLLGFGGTVLLGLATTVVGLVQLRRIGTGAVRSLRASVEGATPPDGALLDGLLTALGALLLIVPGFIANTLGLAMTAPSARRTVANRFGAASRGLVRHPTPRPASPDVIDLGPDDWRPVDRP